VISIVGKDNKQKIHPGITSSSNICKYCGAELRAEEVKDTWGREGFVFNEKTCSIEEKVFEQGEVYVELCECRKYEVKIQDLYSRSNLSRRLKQCTFDRFEQTDGNKKGIQGAKEFVLKMVKDPENWRGIALVGGVGVGKTHLAASIANSLIFDHQVEVVFYDVPELIKTIQDAYCNNGKTSASGILAKLKETPVLILDDLGAEKHSEDVLDKLYYIINSRYNDMKPLVITSNLLPSDLALKIGERMVSRLCEMCEWFKIEGEDYRRKVW
jgi:DNA replication protein DnaC